MRVLQVMATVASENGGTVRSLLAICRSLHSCDSTLKTTLVSTDVGLKDEWQETVKAQLPPEAQLRIFRGFGRGAFVFSLKLTAWLWRHTADFDLIVVGALFSPLVSVAAWIARQKSTPYLVVPHGTLSEYTFQHRRTWLKRLYFRLIDRYTLAGAAAVHCTTESEREQLPRFGGNNPCPVIPHPFESGRHDRPGPPTRCREVLFLARLDPIKGLEVLLEAFRPVRERVPDAVLVVAGSGGKRYESFLRQEIERLGLDQVVRLPGFVEGDVKGRLLNTASVFVLPSRQESFGIAVVEALDAGIPVVITKEVGLSKEVARAEAGFVVERRSEALADALTALLLDPHQCRRMGAKGRELVRARFDSREIGGELLHLYQTAANGLSNLQNEQPVDRHGGRDRGGGAAEQILDTGSPLSSTPASQ